MEIKELPVIRQSVFSLQLENIDNIALIKELESYYSNISASNASSDMRFPQAGEQSSKLQTAINSGVNLVAGKEMECREFWMFSLTDGGAVPLHNHWTNYQMHPEEYYSVAYYPAIPYGAAKIHFVATYCRMMKHVLTVEPSAGMLLIFNSYLDHYTDRNSTTEKRTCISANYRPVSPDKSLVSDWTSFALPRAAQDDRFSKFS